MTSENRAGGTALDVFLSGLLFVDVVMTGLERPPTPGVEVGAAGLSSGPGGIANIAVTCSRLGLRTGLATVCGVDPLGQHCWDALRDVEGVDLTWSRQVEGWRTPLTVALAYDGDRALVTYGTEPPLGQDALVRVPPRSAAAFVHLGADPLTWLARAQSSGTRIFADVGWDPTQKWSARVLDQLDLCHAFVPNEIEARSYTRTDSVEDALAALADRVPLAVITRGRLGAIGIDASTAEVVSVPALRLDAVDTTGAGDAFGAGLIVGTLGGWPLEQRLRFATLVAGLSVTGIGGANAAPTWAEIARWWAAARVDPGQRELVSGYAFLDDVIPGTDRSVVGPQPGQP